MKVSDVICVADFHDFVSATSPRLWRKVIIMEFGLYETQICTKANRYNEIYRAGKVHSKNVDF